MATRWGICGVGKISHDFAVAMKTLPAGDHKIVAVASRTLLNAEEFAKRHGIPKAYGSYEELAKDPEIDVVYLGVINTQHLPAGQLFLRAQKNVLCEKPLAVNSREVKQLIASARDNNVFLMEAIWSLFFPVYKELRRLLAEGAVGEVKIVKAHFGLPKLHSLVEVKMELGGGALLRFGVYCLQFALMVFKGERPESVHATSVRLETGMDPRSPNPNSIGFYSENHQGALSHVVPDPPGGERTGVAVPLPEPSMPLNFANSTGLRYEAEEVRHCLLKGLKESPLMSLEESVLLHEIMDEARRQTAYQTGSEYDSDEDFETGYITGLRQHCIEPTLNPAAPEFYPYTEREQCSPTQLVEQEDLAASVQVESEMEGQLGQSEQEECRSELMSNNEEELSARHNDEDQSEEGEHGSKPERGNVELDSDGEKEESDPTNENRRETVTVREYPKRERSPPVEFAYDSLGQPSFSCRTAGVTLSCYWRPW
ncbi:hypothetical protein GJAV_G00252290 [Gymnothorax javanicus]|nr:hypothetical protein GJAV_G00252290 [Gymnothorax javanicus]